MKATGTYFAVIAVLLTCISSSSGGDKIEGRQRQEGDEDEVTEVSVESVLPGFVQIFNGLVTGNLSDVFFGASSLSQDKNVTQALNEVYNQAIAPPTTNPNFVNSNTSVLPSSIIIPPNGTIVITTMMHKGMVPVPVQNAVQNVAVPHSNSTSTPPTPSTTPSDSDNDNDDDDDEENSNLNKKLPVK